MEEFINKIIQGDCLEKLKELNENSIDLTVTSPPYDNIRTYNSSISQLTEQNFENIVIELFRVTKKGGIVVWVVGDATINFSETLTSFKQAICFKKHYFNVLDTMIYYKQNYAPAYPTLRRYANQFEYMFVFSKGKPKTFNPIQVKKIEHRNGKTGFRKPDGTKTYKILNSSKETKNASNVWSYPMGNKTINHPAVFPEKLAHDHIISWSNEGDTVLDPFMGSGTTGIACKKLNRNFIGIEIDIEYFKLAEERINNTCRSSL